MKRLFRKVSAYLLILVSLWSVFMAMPVQAMESLEGSLEESLTENAFSINIPMTEVLVNQETGQYSFEIQITAEEAYAGAEFGIICGQGTEITSISSTAGSITGPTKAKGLVWFGFFDGEDCFEEEVTVTVEGTCLIGNDSAVVVQDVKVYQVGEQEYKTTYLDGGTIINLCADLQGETEEEGSEMVSEPNEEKGINVVLCICCMVIVVCVTGTLIYKRRNNKQKFESEEKND